MIHSPQKIISTLLQPSWYKLIIFKFNRFSGYLADHAFFISGKGGTLSVFRVSLTKMEGTQVLRELDSSFCEGNMGEFVMGMIYRFLGFFMNLLQCTGTNRMSVFLLFPKK